MQPHSSTLSSSKFIKITIHSPLNIMAIYPTSWHRLKPIRDRPAEVAFERLKHLRMLSSCALIQASASKVSFSTSRTWQ